MIFDMYTNFSIFYIYTKLECEFTRVARIAYKWLILYIISNRRNALRCMLLSISLKCRSVACLHIIHVLCIFIGYSRFCQNTYSSDISIIINKTIYFVRFVQFWHLTSMLIFDFFISIHSPIHAKQNDCS